MYANRGGTFYAMSVNGVRSGLENEAIARGYSDHQVVLIIFIHIRLK